MKVRCKYGEVAGFRQLVEFVEYDAETANDPVYGKESLSKANQSTNGLTDENKKSPPPKSKVESFATNLDAVHKSPPSHGTGFSSRSVSMCRFPLCGKSHDLEDCDAFKRKSVEERRSLADKAFCFACHSDNHQLKCEQKREPVRNARSHIPLCFI